MGAAICLDSSCSDLVSEGEQVSFCNGVTFVAIFGAFGLRHE